MNSYLQIFLVVCGILALTVVAAPLYFSFGWFKFFYHDFMGWHQPIEKEDFNGLSFISKCKYCGKDIEQNSWGDWY